MGQAIGGSLPLAVGIALSPIPIIAVVLMLTSRRARVNGPAFVLGWLAGLAIVGAIVLAVAGAGGGSKSGSPATWVSWVKIVPDDRDPRRPAGHRLPGLRAHRHPRRRHSRGHLLRHGQAVRQAPRRAEGLG